MPTRTNNASRTLFARTLLESRRLLSNIEKARNDLEAYRQRNTNPGDGNFTTEDAKLIHSVLGLLVYEVEDVKKLAHCAYELAENGR